MSEGSAEFDRQAFEARLRKIAEKDKDAIVMLAARCALRVFPLIAYDTSLSCWRVATKRTPGDPLIRGDQRAYHLSRVWTSCLRVWLAAAASYEDGLKEDVRNEVRTARGHIASAAEMVGIDDATYLEVITESPSMTAVVTWAMSVIADTAYVAALIESVPGQALEKMSDMAEALAGLSVASIWDDIDYADNVTRKSDWLHYSLWPDQALPELVYEAVNNRFPKMMSDLAADESARGAGKLHQLIKNIVPAYQLILKGKADVNDLVKTFGLFNRKPQGDAGQQNSEPNYQSVYRPSARNQSELVHGEDALNRTRLADAITKVITAAENKDHLTIGLIGDWGAGKSFLLNLIKEQLQNRSPVMEKDTVDFLVGEFNAWAYEHSDNIHAGVAQEAVAALTQPVLRAPLPTKFASWMRFKHWLAGVWIKTRLASGFVFRQHTLRFATWLLLLILGLSFFVWFFTKEESEIKHIEYFFGTVSLLVIVKGYLAIKGTLLSPLAKVFRTYLRLPSYGEHLGQVPVMREHLRLLCDLRLGREGEKDTKRQTRLLYIIDDLDRCGPEGIVKTFEAVRLMMDIPQVTVIIAVDHRIALAALAHHYDAMAKYPSGRPELAIARDYLAKVIQLPISLARPDGEAVDGYLSTLFERHKGAAADAEAASAGDGGRPNKVAQTEPADKTHGVNGDAESVRPVPVALAATKDKPDASVEVVEVEGISPQHEAAFRHWVRQFGFHNPRQLKRLHNSYNLIRHYYRSDEAPLAAAVANEDSDAPESMEHAYPRMIGLLLLEWLNEQPSAVRVPIINQIEASEAVLETDEAHYPTAVGQALKNLNHAENWYPQVKPFVLPALDPEMEQKPNRKNG